MPFNLKLIPIFICLSRAGQTMAYNVSVISVSKLFPTKFISTAYGVVNMCAHVFACFAPLMAEIPDPYPYIVFEFLTIIAAVASFRIREVKNLDDFSDLH